MTLTENVNETFRREEVAERFAEWYVALDSLDGIPSTAHYLLMTLMGGVVETQAEIDAFNYLVSQIEGNQRSFYLRLDNDGSIRRTLASFLGGQAFLDELKTVLVRGY